MERLTIVLVLLFFIVIVIKLKCMVQFGRKECFVIQPFHNLFICTTNNVTYNEATYFFVGVVIE